MEAVLRQKLKEHKKKYKLSDFDISLDADVSQNTIRRFLIGDGRFMPRTLYKINKYIINFLTQEQKLEATKLDSQILVHENEKYKEALKNILLETDKILCNDYIFSITVFNIKKICKEALK